MRWFTSDLHLGHANIITFCDRPFRDVNHMNTVLIDAINDRVAPDDELWILGDVAMGDIMKSLAQLKRIMATTVLVAGNHDRVHPVYGGATKALRWMPDYLDVAGFDRVFPGTVDLTLSDGTSVQVSHFPATPEDHRPERADKFNKYRPIVDGRGILHGHTHGMWRQHGLQIDVGVDAWGGVPVPETTVLQMLADPADRDPLPWS